MRLDAITGFMVERYKTKHIDAGSANGTVNRELATLSHQKPAAPLHRNYTQALNGSRQQRPQLGGKEPQITGS